MERKTSAKRSTNYGTNCPNFPVSQAEAGADALMKGICEMIGAGNAYWLGYIRLKLRQAIPLKGCVRSLPPGANRYLYPQPPQRRVFRAQTIKWNRKQVNEGYIFWSRVMWGNFAPFDFAKCGRRICEAEFYQAFHASGDSTISAVVIFPMNNADFSPGPLRPASSGWCAKRFPAPAERPPLPRYTPCQGIQVVPASLQLARKPRSAHRRDSLSPVRRQIRNSYCRT